MSTTGRWQLRIYENGQEYERTFPFSGSVQLGRQRSEGETPFSQQPLSVSGMERVVIARLDEYDRVSRTHAVLTALTGLRFRVENISQQLPIGLPDGTELAEQKSCELTIPATLTFGRRGQRAVRIEEAQPPLESLWGQTRRPGDLSILSSRLPALSLPISSGVDKAALMQWLQTAMGVLQSAAGASDFIARAEEAVVSVVGLDTGRVLLREADEWRAARTKAADDEWEPSAYVLARVCAEKRTFWQVPDAVVVGSESLVGVKAVVAAPILDPQGAVIGALYGDRRRYVAGGNAPITQLEAMLVELLAGGVAAGLARVQHEQMAVAARVRFEQFFTKEMARQLEARPDLLQGRECEVTILFGDIRGFSGVSEKLIPARTIEWINDVLEVMSQCVLAEQGVLVDYVGDALMAMWGAPEQQPDHAARACRAALAMLERVPALNARWEPVVGHPLGLGIGLNTGTAQVGNIGSQQKFKYGPLGNTVNLASRVQGVSKFLKCDLVATQATQVQLGPEFGARKLCTVRVLNIKQELDLYEVSTLDRPGWADCKETYEHALQEFEQEQFRRAAQLLAKLVSEDVNDGPALVLMARAVRAMVEGTPHGHPVWELKEK